MLVAKKIPIRYILGKIKYDILFMLLIGIIIHTITTFFENIIPKMPITIPAFLGTSISVILSFKLSQSYDRWWEARKIWGSIVNDARTLTIQIQSFAPIKDESIKNISYRQIAWCYSLGQSLRNLNPLENMSKFLKDEEIIKIRWHSNIPLAILKLNSAEIAALHAEKKIDDFTRMQMDNTLVRLCDSMGRAERIKSTVFPNTYRIYLHFIIYLFVISLSISLYDLEIYYEIPLLAIISSCFFLLEKSAYHMQDPFSNRPSDTPVTAIARTIEINIRQLLGEEEVPEPVKPNDFYIL